MLLSRGPEVQTRAGGRPHPRSRPQRAAAVARLHASSPSGTTRRPRLARPHLRSLPQILTSTLLRLGYRRIALSDRKQRWARPAIGAALTRDAATDAIGGVDGVPYTSIPRLPRAISASSRRDLSPVAPINCPLFLLASRSADVGCSHASAVHTYHLAPIRAATTPDSRRL